MARFSESCLRYWFTTEKIRGLCVAVAPIEYQATNLLVMSYEPMRNQRLNLT
jgi:hypothetical protein